MYAQFTILKGMGRDTVVKILNISKRERTILFLFAILRSLAIPLPQKKKLQTTF